MWSRPPIQRTLRIALLAAAAAAPGAACNRDGRSGKLVLPPGGSTEAVAEPALRVVVATSSLRREPGEPTRAKGDASSGAPSGVLATLCRGERVTFLDVRDGWSRVKAPGGQEGWLRNGSLAPASETQEGTVLGVTWAFDQPDLVAPNARRKVEPGTLLFIRKSKDLFTEVDAGTGGSAWILTDRLSTQPGDLSAARIVEKARQLLRSDRPAEAREALALLRSTLPGSPLVPVLAADLGEAPGGGPPEGAGTPSGPDSGVPAPSGPGGTP